MVKTNRNPKFYACLPLVLREQKKYKRVSLAKYTQLPEECRCKWVGASYYRRPTYNEIIFIAPYENPCVKELIALLRAHKVVFEVKEILKNGVPFIEISAGGYHGN